MAKRSGFGTFLLIGGVAAVAAAGVAAYMKRAELKKLTDDIMAKMKPTDEEGVYTADLDDDGETDIILADTTGDGQVDTILMDTDGDGSMDAAAIDVDGDGTPDVMVTDLDIQPAQDCGDCGEDSAE